MDVIARPVVVPRVRACSTWGLLPVPSSLFSLVGGGAASESSEEVRVVSPSPTAGCSLAGGITSVSWPAVGGVAGVAASAAGSGVKLCPSTSVGGAVTVGAATADPAGASGPPPAPAAVPGVFGIQQHQEASCSSRCHRRLSSDGTDRRSKKRSRGGSPSPGSSSRRR